jgi:glycosyltransferase involved in cell wall biosynthesis
LQIVTHQGRKYRLLYVIDDMGTGGAQRQLARTVNGLDPERFSADIVCLDRGGATVGQLPPSRPVHVLGMQRVFDHKAATATVRLARIIRRGRYDMVEAYLPAAHFICAAAIGGAARPLLVAARRNLASLDPAWFAALAPFVERATSLSIANSRAVKRSVMERYGTRGSRIAVVGNAVELTAPADSRAARRRLGIPEDHFVIAAAGMMTRVKDYPTMVRAFARFAAANRKAILAVAGDGPERGRVQKLAGRLGLNGEARFLGVLADTRLLLAAADVFVHTSKSEGSSNAVLEAAASGLPVLAADIESNREALGEDGACYFAPGKWRECFEGLKRLAADEEERLCLGALAAERVHAKFNACRIIEKRQRLYTRMLEAVNDYNSARGAGRDRAVGLSGAP